MSTSITTMRSPLTIAALLPLLLVGCKKEEAPAPAQGEAAAPAKVAPPTPVQEALVGGPYPSLLVTQAWFWKDEADKSRPGPARLQIWRMGEDGRFKVTRLEDGDSNVFHKALPYDGGILTIGAEKAEAKLWTFKDGAWSSKLIWERSWGGKFDRLRDLEIGDVDQDGKPELVIATHDAGVVAVVNPDVEGEGRVIELDEQSDTFVHEIEIGDIDGDGKLEFFATPTDRNQVGVSQAGHLVMYRWDGTTYQKTMVDPMGETHAKEILATDIDGDGKSELFAVLEAELDASKQISKPVEIRQYLLKKDGTFDQKVVATIADRQTRFLVPGDFDGDGRQELVAAAMKTGLWYLDEQADGHWEIKNFDTQSSGFEHATYAADLDGDGALELYVAADDQKQMRRYDFDKENGRFNRTVLGPIPERTFTWNITAGRF